MKKQIEYLYINASFNDEAPNVFADKILDLIGIDDAKQSRSNLQSRSRWKYLTMIASILNDQGQTYTPLGTRYQVKWTKDNLYEIYWQSVRKDMFPGKNRQLNTKEFSDLVEMVMILFAELFEITIPFPNKADLILPSE